MGEGDERVESTPTGDPSPSGGGETPPMADLAAAEDLDRLEELWLDRVESPGPIEPYLEVVEILTRAGYAERAATLVTLLAEALLASGRHADALRILRPIAKEMKTGVDVEALRPLALRALTGLHGAEEWFPLFLRRSGLDGEGPVREGLETFESLLPYRPGCPVIHYREDRPALIESVDPADGTSVIRFPDGTERRLSLDVTQELMAPLDRDDWRAQMMTRPEALREEALESPAGILRNAVRARGGRAAAPQIKADLHGAVIPEAKWNTWWKRAREEAARDPFIAVEGSRTRPIFVLRERPLSLEEESIRQVQWARGLAEAVARARQYRGEGISTEVAREIAGEVARRLQAEERALRSKEPGVLLEAALAVEAWGEKLPIDPYAILGEVMTDSEGSAERLAKVLSTVPSREGRSAALERMQSAFPDLWADRLLAAVGWISGPAVEEVSDLLLRHGEADRLSAAFRRLLDAPFRHREAVIHLSRLWVSGKLGDGLRPVELLDALLVLARDLARPPRGERVPPRLLRGLVGLLVGGRDPLIVGLLKEATPDDFERWSVFVESAPDLPWELAEAIRARAPADAAEQTPAFLEGGAIYCTREGIGRRREELRVLLEEKIPANQKALGEAASHGDLSDNAEWQAAIEEQRNLAQVHRVMEEEISRAVPIEDHPPPGDVVSPGTRVTYREEETGQEKVVSILGPWDTGEEVVSYRAPLARGLLGCKVGERVRLALPGGEVEVTIREIDVVS